MPLSSIAVFCGSATGINPAYADAAGRLGALLARQRRRLVYGGGNIGLMGVCADAALAHGGQVIGVIPQHLLDREVGHAGLTQLHVVQSMHERKQLMSDLADAFILLPGGLGSLEEFFETWTWGQLGLHHKPYGLLDTNGYYAPLLAFLDHAVSEGFVRRAHRELLVIETEPERLLERLDHHVVPDLPKLVDRSRT